MDPPTHPDGIALEWPDFSLTMPGPTAPSVFGLIFVEADAMSVVLECSIDAAEFRLGRVLSGPEEQAFELERIVPIEDELIIPLVWVRGADQAAVLERLESVAVVEDVDRLEWIDDRALYRIDWAGSPTDLVGAIAAADGSVLEGHGTPDEWHFQLRFPDQERLTRFHEDVREWGIRLTVERTYQFASLDGDGNAFGLTEEQRVALTLALERGYFETPREVGLAELAGELDITRQALSRRIRRANRSVLETALQGTDVTPDRA